MASSVTAPLERQFGQMPGLNQMTSTSSSGSSVITLQFALEPRPRRGRAGGAGGDQRRASRSCRPTCPNPPVYSKVNPADTPILTLGADLGDAAAAAGRGPGRHAAGPEDRRSCRASGWSASAAGSGRRCGCRPTRRRSPPTASRSRICAPAVAAANVNQAKGSFDGPRQASVIGANDQLLTSRDYRPLIVAYRNGAPVRADRRGRRRSTTPRTCARRPG